MSIKKLIILAAIIAISSSAQAARKTITVGTSGSKASLDTNFGNANDNFVELYGNVDQGVKTTDNPSFASVHASGGNLAAANKQVTKAWMSSASVAYTADVTSVIHGGHHWICKLSHTSNATGAEPGVGGSWTTYWTYVGEVLQTVRTTVGGGSTTASPSEVAVGDALAGKQDSDVDLTDLADGSLTGTKVGFADTDNLFTATNLQAAIEEFNDSINAGAPNGIGAKVHWSELTGVPAGFADGSDDGASGVPAAITVADTTDTTSYVGLFESATGDLGPKTNANLTFNSSTGGMGVTLFTSVRVGDLSHTPTGTTQMIACADGNHQKLTLASTSGNLTLTLTVPASSSAGVIFVTQHATTARDVTVATSSGAIIWLGTKRLIAADVPATKKVILAWSFDGTDTWLSLTDNN